MIPRMLSLVGMTRCLLRGPVVPSSQLPIGLETSLSAVSQDGIRVLVPA